MQGVPLFKNEKKKKNRKTNHVKNDVNLRKMTAATIEPIYIKSIERSM